MWASDDGLEWREVLGARVPEDENAYEWFNWIASGDLGTVVAGNREHNHYQSEMPPPLTITQNEYTLTFDDYDWPPRVTVVDNVTGDTVIDVRLGEDEQVSLPEGFYYEDGVTIIENNDSVLMTITDEEFDAAQQARWAEEAQLYEPATPTMYFSTDLDEWFEVSLDGVVDGWINHVAVGTDAVVLASMVEGDHMILFEEGSALADDIELAPSELVIFVGRPVQ